MASVWQLRHEVKPECRRVGWLWRMPSGIGVLRITLDGEETYYFVRPLEGHVYEVGKLVEGSGITTDYHVHLEPGNESCDCPGGTYKGRCKHVPALLALKSNGRL